MYGRPPRKPPVLTVVTLLHWAFVAGTFALADLAILSALTTAGGALTGVLLAVVWAALGLLNVPAVLAIDRLDLRLSRWASLVTAVVFGGALVRSAVMGSAGPIEWTVMIAMLVVCLLNVFLATRPRR
jgi:uncharacterized membrane protein YfcA